MTISNILLKALRKAIGVIEGLKIDYCLFGGLAMQAYKRLRSTMDVDLILNIDEGKISALISGLENSDFKFDSKKGIVKVRSFEFLRFVWMDKESGIDVSVDIVTARTEFQKEIIQHRQPLELFDTKTYTASCEDLILLKILAGRPLDKVDAESLIADNKKELNEKYLTKWANVLGIERQLHRMLKG